jgi:hypothetical protein
MPVENYLDTVEYVVMADIADEFDSHLIGRPGFAVTCSCGYMYAGVICTKCGKTLDALAAEHGLFRREVNCDTPARKCTTTDATGNTPCDPSASS